MALKRVPTEIWLDIAAASDVTGRYSLSLANHMLGPIATRAIWSDVTVNPKRDLGDIDMPALTRFAQTLLDRPELASMIRRFKVTHWGVREWEEDIPPLSTLWTRGTAASWRDFVADLPSPARCTFERLGERLAASRVSQHLLMYGGVGGILAVIMDLMPRVHALIFQVDNSVYPLALVAGGVFPKVDGRPWMPLAFQVVKNVTIEGLYHPAVYNGTLDRRIIQGLLQLPTLVNFTAIDRGTDHHSDLDEYNILGDFQIHQPSTYSTTIGSILLVGSNFTLECIDTILSIPFSLTSFELVAERRLKGRLPMLPCDVKAILQKHNLMALRDLRIQGDYPLYKQPEPNLFQGFDQLENIWGPRIAIGDPTQNGWASKLPSSIHTLWLDIGCGRSLKTFIAEIGMHPGWNTRFLYLDHMQLHWSGTDMDLTPTEYARIINQLSLLHLKLDPPIQSKLKCSALHM